MKFAIVNRNAKINGVFEERNSGKYLNYCGGWKRFEDFEDCRLYKTVEDAEETIEDCIDLWDYYFEDGYSKRYCTCCKDLDEISKEHRPNLEVVQVKFIEL